MRAIKLVVYCAFCVGFVYSASVQDFYEWEAGWQKFLCERNDRALLEELKECMALSKTKDIIEAFAKCQLHATPGVIDPADFVEAGCADNEIFEKYNTCFQPYVEEEGFFEKIKENDKTYECYDMVMKNHGFNIELKI